MVMFLLSLVFTVSATVVLGAIVAFPVTFFITYFIPELFTSYSQAFECLTLSFALAFLGITFFSRLAHVYLEGPAYFKETYFYEYIVS